jgi:hypothetical protein
MSAREGMAELYTAVYSARGPMQIAVKHYRRADAETALHNSDLATLCPIW